MGSEVLPWVYRDIVEVVADAPGPVRAKQIVPRIGLPWMSPACSLWPAGGWRFAQLPLTAELFRAYIRRPNRKRMATVACVFDTWSAQAPA